MTLLPPCGMMYTRIDSFRCVPFVSFRSFACPFVGLLRKHLLDLFVAEVDLVHLVPAQLERHIFVVAVRRDEDLGVPDKALRGSEVGDLVIQMLAMVLPPCCCTASCRR